MRCSSTHQAVGVLSFALAMFCVSPRAQGVVISGGDGTGNTSAPSNDPGWNNVGFAGGGTAVYLGNRWVITAAHVGVQSVTLAGKSFTPEAGSAVQLSNPTGVGLTANADLLMYRLTANPGLAGLSVSTSTLPFSSSVTMIGAGRDRAPDQVGWQVTSNGNGHFTWTEVPPPAANVRGYLTLDTRHMRYGENSVQTNGDIVNHSTTFGDTLSSSSPFNESSIFLDQGQAVTGDSGGGVFSVQNGHWLLAGVINSMQSQTDQPTGTVVFGDQTEFADLSRYATQIKTLLSSADPALAWQNSTNPLDVNNDHNVTALDALVIINELNKNGSHSLPLPPVAGAGPPPYYDVLGQGNVQPLDALMVINYLNNPSGAPAGEVLLGHPLPEPSTGLLALAGLALVCILAAARRAVSGRVRSAA